MRKKDTSKKYRIAVDAMGGDFAPDNEVRGAISALENKDSNVNLEIILVGNETKIRSSLSQYDYTGKDITIVNAEEVVTMDDEPTVALKKKRNSSLFKGVELHKLGYADAFISAGNTGAVLSTSTVLLGRINGASRPTIGTFMPTQNNYPTLVLDVGATIDLKSRFLYEFGVMGSIYVTQMLGIENPRVGLLNIGEEPTKGTEVIKETYKLLKSSDLNFIGNVEGRDILLGSADIVVCDGFTGNVVLKLAESFLSFLKFKIKSYAAKNIFNKIMAAIIAPVLKKVFKEIDYAEHGGVPLLGVNGVVIIGHGKSPPKAVQNMIYKAVELVRKDVNNKMETALNHPLISEKSGK